MRILGKIAKISTFFLEKFRKILEFSKKSQKFRKISENFSKKSSSSLKI